MSYCHLDKRNPTNHQRNLQFGFLNGYQINLNHRDHSQKSDALRLQFYTELEVLFPRGIRLGFLL